MKKIRTDLSGEEIRDIINNKDDQEPEMLAWNDPDAPTCKFSEFYKCRYANFLNFFSKDKVFICILCKLDQIQFNLRKQ